MTQDLETRRHDAYLSWRYLQVGWLTQFREKTSDPSATSGRPRGRRITHLQKKWLQMNENLKIPKAIDEH
ncbi:Citrate synthase [Dirofilaria immitis]